MLRMIPTGPRFAAATATALLGLAGLALAGCERPSDQAAVETPTEVPQPAPAEALTPLPPPPVNRAQLLQAIADARSAYAAGQAHTDAALAGRRFAIRQAFGCGGPSQAATEARPGVARWTWGARRQTIEIGLTPADWAASPVLTAAGARWEAVEGYWLTRPWLRTDDCPATRTDAQATAEAAAAQADGAGSMVSGLAAVFAQNSSRVNRRDGRPFALTLRGDPPLSPAVNGYRLVIEGRFSAFPEGQAIRCHAPTIDQPPVCIAAAEVDRVAFEDADGQLLKEWRVG